MDNCNYFLLLVFVKVNNESNNLLLLFYTSKTIMGEWFLWVLIQAYTSLSIIMPKGRRDILKCMWWWGRVLEQTDQHQRKFELSSSIACEWPIFHSASNFLHLLYQTGMLSSCRCVSTTVWLHYLDFNETSGEKTIWYYSKMFCAVLVGCWLVGFYGISTFIGYLTPNPFLCK